MVEFNGDLAITSLSTTATVVLLNLLGIVLAIYPKHDSGPDSGLITQHGIQVRCCHSMETQLKPSPNQLTCCFAGLRKVGC